MSLFVASLNSGSNGNCYYVGNDEEAILVDVGISCKEVEKRMARIGLNIRIVKAIFVSHEHTDHIKGIPVLARKYQLPVYVTLPTWVNGGLHIDDNLLRPIASFDEIRIGEINITAFPKIHDAADPHSFLVECNGVKIGVFTDLGHPCEQLIRYFKECHAAFLEANYDEEMLNNSRYPYFLKNRIRGGRGHLSNSQALELFKAHRSPYLKRLFLSHLSRENNCPDLVANLFSLHANGVEITVASRYQETDVYHIQHYEKPTDFAMTESRTYVQASLF
ncbi:MBL fold metallo-hydrolase [Pedobacter sp. HMF7647]|uniref:MBL fold metallo-hydrolase n=1 Tax=Hufsiella arboris TaxID=2695275 RepID=A0A7K1YCK6_9SPHI|nr:MBL fold metallo-hydrolase [Hufsiella arboris]MXV52316.1 MBL fold metallo-hydrolase [Hufsiella arboris]